MSSIENKLSIVLCNSLSSEQEEADAKVFLCVKFAFHIGLEKVNTAVKTDVAIVGMYLGNVLASPAK